MRGLFRETFSDLASGWLVLEVLRVCFGMRDAIRRLGVTLEAWAGHVYCYVVWVVVLRTLASACLI